MKDTCFITDIQRYCIHDGDGIRTTIFFKGCPLHCLWCHNPETQNFLPQLLDQPEKCTGCGMCIQTCRSQAVAMKNRKAYTDRKCCIGCGLCEESCVQNLREVSGKPYTVSQLLDEACKDEMFYEESGGGVTLSGGEVMAADMDFLEALLIKLKRFGVNCTIDTCGMADWGNFERILPYVDTFLYDVKVMSEELHKEYTGVSNQQILFNLKKLSDAGANIYLRIPVIREVNGSIESMKDIITFIKDKQIQVSKICLLPYHNTGSSKYERLGGAYPGKGFHAPDAEGLHNYIELFQKEGYQQVQIGG